VIRAIFFDFYSVWAEDKFALYVNEAGRQNPELARQLQDVMQQYYFGMIDVTAAVDSFRFKLNRPDIDASDFILREADISSGLIDFLRELHGHFLKLGVLANLGLQEFQLLNDFNAHNQLLEVITGPLPQKLPAALLSQEVFAAALQQIGEPPKSCLVVSGHDDYLNFASGLGLAAARFEGFPKLKQSIEQMVANNA
jgi:FMN phosphatase YigB (HAD superfamily)